MPQNDFFGDDSSPLASPTGSPSAASYLDDSFRDELLSPAPAQRTSEAAARASTSGRASSAAAYGGARSRGTRGDSPTLEDILGEAPAGKKERSIQTLMRAWTNETAAPELLHFPRELVERIVRDLARRVSGDTSFRGTELIGGSIESGCEESERAGGEGGELVRYCCHCGDREHEGCPCPQVFHAREDL
jgi:hypothetical protein